jgi:hypothetical protein
MAARSLAAVAIALAVSGGACTAQGTSGGDPRGLGFQVTTDTRYAVWLTDQDNNGDPLDGYSIDYHTDGMLTWAVAAVLTWKRDRLFGVSVQRPFEATPGDHDVLVKVESPTMSIEDYLAFLRLPFLKDLGDRPYISFLSGLQLEYWRHVFHGSGEAVTQCIFAGGNTDRMLLDPHEEFRFAADFEDWNLSLPLYVDPRGLEVRAGVYRSQIRKPHETILSVVAAGGAGPLIVEALMTSWGGFVSLESAPFEMLMRMGAVKFEPQGHVEEYGLFDSTGSFDWLLHIRWTPHFTLAGSRDRSRGIGRGLYLIPILGVDLRWDYLESDTTGLGIDDFELSADMVLETGLRLEWVY